MVKPLVHVPKVFILHAKERLAGNLRFNVQGCLNEMNACRYRKGRLSKWGGLFLYLPEDRRIGRSLSK